MIETSKLHEYVDGELSDAERKEVEAQLAHCKESQAEVASIQNLKGVLSGVSNMECDDVWNSCKSRLDAIDRVTRSGNFITKYSWGFVTAVAMIVLVGGGFARHAQANSVDSSSLAGIFSNSRQTSPEKAIRNEQLDQLLKYADRNLSKVNPVSYTAGTVNGFPAERYDLRDVQGNLSLIVLPQISSFEGMTPNADGKYFYGQIESNMNAVGWKVKGAALILVGPRDYNSLENVARSNFTLPE
jgi:hypothetical protein